MVPPCIIVAQHEYNNKSNTSGLWISVLLRGIAVGFWVMHWPWFDTLKYILWLFVNHFTIMIMITSSWIKYLVHGQWQLTPWVFLYIALVKVDILRTNSSINHSQVTGDVHVGPPFWPKEKSIFTIDINQQPD